MKENQWKRKMLLALLLHGIIFISELYFLLREKEFPHYARYFTNLSNILAGGASLLMLITLSIALIKKQCRLWRPALVLQLAAACSVGLTFLVVVTFLAPNEVRGGSSYFKLFKGEVFHTHFLNCILSGLCAALLHPDVRLNKGERWVGLLPTVLYGIVYGICVFSGKWPDFYGFTFGNQLSVGLLSALITGAVSLLLSFAYSGIHNRLLPPESR